MGATGGGGGGLAINAFEMSLVRGSCFQIVPSVTWHNEQAHAKVVHLEASLMLCCVIAVPFFIVSLLLRRLFVFTDVESDNKQWLVTGRPISSQSYIQRSRDQRKYIFLSSSQFYTSCNPEFTSRMTHSSSYGVCLNTADHRR